MSEVTVLCPACRLWLRTASGHDKGTRVTGLQRGVQSFFRSGRGIWLGAYMTTNALSVINFSVCTSGES